jgi:hypothetical protein
MLDDSGDGPRDLLFLADVGRNRNDIQAICTRLRRRIREDVCLIAQNRYARSALSKHPGAGKTNPAASSRHKGRPALEIA